MLAFKKRIQLDRDVLVWIRQALAMPRVELLPLTPEISVAAAGFGVDFAGDPADRIIAATALELRAPLVTKDLRLRAFKQLKTIW
jgi:PIN domain nuclease of toxin-antitoxin system